MNIHLPFGRTHLTAELPDHRLQAVLCSRLESYRPPMGESELVQSALDNPIGSPKLEELAVGKENIVLIASDHTRPVGSHLWREEAGETGSKMCQLQHRQDQREAPGCLRARA